MSAKQREKLNGHLLATCQWDQVGMGASQLLSRRSHWSKGEPQLTFQSWVRMTPPPPLSLHCMAQTYPYEGLRFSQWIDPTRFCCKDVYNHLALIILVTYLE